MILFERESILIVQNQSNVFNSFYRNNVILTKDNRAKITHGGYYTVFPNARAAVKADGYKDFRMKLGYFSSRALGGIAEVANDIFSLGAVSHHVFIVVYTCYGPYP